MTALFVALGIMVLALLALLLWFVPRLLQQQAVRVSDESAQLREMLLDLLSEQEAGRFAKPNSAQPLRSCKLDLMWLRRRATTRLA